jgi:hypothetical protein
VNLGQARVVIRERAMAEIIDLSFRFVLGLERRLYLWLSVWFLLPAFALCAGARFFGLSWLWVWCLAIGVRALCDAPFTIAAGRVMFERGLRVRPVVRDSFTLGWRFLWVTVVRISGMLLSALPLITLPLIVPRLLFLNEIVLLERLRVGEALRRGERFLGRRRWTGIEASLALAALPLVAAVFCDALGQSIVSDVLEFQTSGGLFEDGGSYYALLGFLGSAPFASALRYLVYIDVRTRREAWDVQVRFQRVSLDLARGLS